MVYRTCTYITNHGCVTISTFDLLINGWETERNSIVLPYLLVEGLANYQAHHIVSYEHWGVGKELRILVNSVLSSSVLSYLTSMVVLRPKFVIGIIMKYSILEGVKMTGKLKYT